MRDQINNKFKNIRQKWFYISLDCNEFSSVLDDITASIREGRLTSFEAIDLIKRFKENKKAWIKLIAVRG